MGDKKRSWPHRRRRNLGFDIIQVRELGAVRESQMSPFDRQSDHVISENGQNGLVGQILIPPDSLPSASGLDTDACEPSQTCRARHYDCKRLDLSTLIGSTEFTD